LTISSQFCLFDDDQFGLDLTGVHVVGLDINKEALNELRATLSPAKCDTLACDLLNITDIRDTVNGYMDQHGPIDLLVNCAGVAKFEPFFDTTPKAFDLQMGINVKALFYLTQLVTQRMVEAKVAGSVVHISSQSSTLPLADHLIYSSSKATVDHMARIQAFELGPHGIRVNTVRPTVVLTKLALEQWDVEDLEVMKNQIPLKKLATTKDVAMAVSWLLSDEASMVTGSTLAVDGGRSMGGYGL
jgi:NAD(P)-dependent dehydrogenase (short-subunit alcohol dehydrogenase family)